MIRNYFKIAWRNIVKNKTMFGINIAGLALGLGSCLIIGLFVIDELSYDQFHENSDRIARVYLNAKIGDELIKEAGVMAPVAKALLNDLPEVVDATRIIKTSNRTVVTYGNNTIRKGKMAFVDPNFFEIFSLPLIKGDIKTALSKPNSLILTQEQAKAYFGTKDPLNKIVDIKDIGVHGPDGYIDNSGPYTVTGIISEIPANSHFHFDLLASMQSNKDAINQSWLSGSYHTYLLLGEGTDMALLEAKLSTITEKYMSSQMESGLGMTFREFLDKGNHVGLYLQPLTKIHLYSESTGEFEEGGDINTVYMFAAIASFMLLIACINFMNLSTAGASKRAKEIGIRSGLVVFQFALSTCLIIGTLVVSQQMHYIQNKDIGYDREELIVIRDAGLLGDKLNAFKTELQKDSRILSITTSAFVPAGPTDNNGATLYSHLDKSQKLRTKVYNIDEAYIPTLGMELLAGRNFSKDFGPEENNIIINETAVQSFGLNKNPVGQTLEESTNLKGGRRTLTIIGVVKDFHSRSLHEPILPLMMKYNPYYGLIARVKTANMSGVIANMENQWKALGTGEAFDYAFLDALYNETYIKEQNMNSVLKIFAILTIFVACLGLFGLVTFTTEQRVKEIGVRKVLGSSISQIVTLLSKDFLKLVLLSFVIAFPIGYYFMDRWLRDFSYRTDIRWWIFVLTAVITILIAVITISLKSIKAALQNPVKSLKTE